MTDETTAHYLVHHFWIEEKMIKSISEWGAVMRLANAPRSWRAKNNAA